MFNRFILLADWHSSRYVVLAYPFGRLNISIGRPDAASIDVSRDLVFYLILNR